MAEFAPDIMARAEAVLRAAEAAHLRIAVAESCTGGLVIACLTAIPGASNVVDRGFVTYTDRSKTELLGVANELIAAFGSVSEPVARKMAEGAIGHSHADVAVAVTGIAGPGGARPNKPVGTVHLAALRRDGETVHEVYHFGDLGRAEVRRKAVAAALNIILSRL